MAEAFVKTFKRDYARVSAKPDAASVLRQLDSWFEHYNSVHPHKALGYRSPREFRKQLAEKATENAVGAVRRPYEGTAQPWTTPNNYSLSGYSGATTAMSRQAFAEMTLPTLYSVAKSKYTSPPFESLRFIGQTAPPTSPP